MVTDSMGRRERTTLRLLTLDRDDDRSIAPDATLLTFRLWGRSGRVLFDSSLSSSPMAAAFPDTVRLDRPLLEKQFGEEKGAK